MLLKSQENLILFGVEDYFKHSGIFVHFHELRLRCSENVIVKVIVVIIFVFWICLPLPLEETFFSCHGKIQYHPLVFYFFFFDSWKRILGRSEESKAILKTLGRPGTFDSHRRAGSTYIWGTHHIWIGNLRLLREKDRQGLIILRRTTLDGDCIIHFWHLSLHKKS